MGSAPPEPSVSQEDLTFAGQRRINLIWEYTQAIIAIMVVVATMAAGVVATLKNTSPVNTALSMAFGTVVGFYFGRTNHSATGGVGPQPGDRDYRGR